MREAAAQQLQAKASNKQGVTLLASKGKHRLFYSKLEHTDKKLVFASFRSISYPYKSSAGPFWQYLRCKD
eukprot:6486961-Amphidinium_carterae.1